MLLQRHCFKQSQSLEERLVAEAKRLSEQAKLLPSGEAREIALRKIRLPERPIIGRAFN